jgi:hypothetical protein
MRSFEITEVKPFMSALLAGQVFDNFAVSELKMNNAGGWVLDGKRNADFYTSEELEELPEKEYLLWSEVKHIVFGLVKGSKLPLSLHITFRLNGANTRSTVSNSGTRIPLENVGGIFLNVRYDREQLQVVSGTSLKSFSMDRSLENAWDEYAERFLRKNGLI